MVQEGTGGRINRRLWRVKRLLYWGMIRELALVIYVLVRNGLCARAASPLGWFLGAPSRQVKTWDGF